MRLIVIRSSRKDSFYWEKGRRF